MSSSVPSSSPVVAAVRVALARSQRLAALAARPWHTLRPVCKLRSMACRVACGRAYKRRYVVTGSTSLGLGGCRRQMLQPLSGLAGFLGALPGVGPPPTAPAVQPRANCCNPFGIGGDFSEGGDRREEREEGRSERDRRDHGLQTAVSSVFIRFYLWFNSFRAFF